MEHGIALICFLFIVVAYIAGRVGFGVANDKDGTSGHGAANDAVDEAIRMEDAKPRNLLLKTLEDIGCQYEMVEDDGIVFKYQGETFQINASNDSAFIWIYDLAWGQVGLSTPEAELLKQAINKVNEYTAVTSLYTIDQEHGVVAAHCRVVIYFTGNIEAPGNYLRSVLNSFFEVHRFVKNEMDKLCERAERIEIKGFSQ